MSSQIITYPLLPESLPRKILESLPKPNLAAWFALLVVVFIWYELSPIWLPPVSWLISFLAPIFWLVLKIFLVLAAVLLGGFGALLGLLLGGTIPSSR